MTTQADIRFLTAYRELDGYAMTADTRGRFAYAGKRATAKLIKALEAYAAAKGCSVAIVQAETKLGWGYGFSDEYTLTIFAKDWDCWQTTGATPWEAASKMVS